MSRESRTPTAERPIAVLLRAGDVTRGLIGTTAGPKVQVIAWQEFRSGLTGEITRWLDEHEAGSVIGVLPSASVVCRTCTLPEADQQHLEQALALQAEAHMLDGVSPHREARAVLPAAGGETSRSGIIVKWPEAPGDGKVPGAYLVDPDAATPARPVTFTPDVAALGAILNGRRPDEPLIWFDRNDGSLAVAISHSNGAILRAARVSANGGWTDSVSRAIAETALSVGHTPAFTETLVRSVGRRLAALEGRSGFLAPYDVVQDVRQRVDGAPDETGWWRDYGVALGALLASSGELAPLTHLRLAVPAASPSRVRRAAEMLSDPATALGVTAVCVLIVMLAPLLFSGFRLAVLKAKMPDLSESLTTAHDIEYSLAMYRELKEQAWPMTKLLSDLATNTPEGIDLDHIRVGYGEGFRVSGRAKPSGGLSAQEVMARMQQNLRESGIFVELRLSYGDPNSFKAYEFALSGKVVAPYHRRDYPRDLDYGALTLSERLYGPASETVEPVNLETSPLRDEELFPEEIAERNEGGAEDEAATPGNGREPRHVAPPRSDDAPIGRGTRRPLRGNVPASQDIPEPLTQEQIDAMELAEAQETYYHLSRALQQARVDEETKERLWADWRLVRDRVRDLKRKQPTEAGP